MIAIHLGWIERTELLYIYVVNEVRGDFRIVTGTGDGKMQTNEALTSLSHENVSHGPREFLRIRISASPDFNLTLFRHVVVVSCNICLSMHHCKC